MREHIAIRVRFGIVGSPCPNYAGDFWALARGFSSAPVTAEGGSVRAMESLPASFSARGVLLTDTHSVVVVDENYFIVTF